MHYYPFSATAHKMMLFFSPICHSVLFYHNTAQSSKNDTIFFAKIYTLYKSIPFRKKWYHFLRQLNTFLFSWRMWNPYLSLLRIFQNEYQTILIPFFSPFSIFDTRKFAIFSYSKSWYHLFRHIRFFKNFPNYYLRKICRFLWSVFMKMIPLFSPLSIFSHFLPIN